MVLAAGDLVVEMTTSNYSCDRDWVVDHALAILEAALVASVEEVAIPSEGGGEIQ